ncbi:MAG: hypothetical protein ILO64_05995 [Clostridia bacterium]|nr:hypothetical protein [Clostridia bacterium]
MLIDELSKAQFEELTKSLDKLPPFFNDVKNAIVNGYGYWYPLSGLTPPMKTAVYSLDRIYNDNKIEMIKRVLEIAEITKATGFHPYWFEGQPRWKTVDDMKTILFTRDSYGYVFPETLEEYYYDDTETWIIYVSHEGTITFSGERLSQIAESVISDEYRYPQL